MEGVLQATHMVLRVARGIHGIKPLGLKLIVREPVIHLGGRLPGQPACKPAVPLDDSL
jgi:hypothetical protein